MAKLLDDRVRILRTHPAGAATPQVFECYPLRETAAPEAGKHNGASFGDRRCRGKRKWSSEEPVPWPNMFWLACPDTVRRVGRLEHLGYVKKFQERLKADPALVAEFEANHRAYGARRFALLDDEAFPTLDQQQKGQSKACKFFTEKGWCKFGKKCKK